MLKTTPIVTTRSTTQMMKDEPTPVFWALEDNDLRAMLKQVADGADPEMVYMEWYANCTIEHVEGDDDGSDTSGGDL